MKKFTRVYAERWHHIVLVFLVPSPTLVISQATAVHLQRRGTVGECSSMLTPQLKDDMGGESNRYW